MPNEKTIQSILKTTELQDIMHDYPQELGSNITTVKSVLTPEIVSKIAYLTVQGYTNAAIAENLGVPIPIIQQARKTEEFKSMMHALTSEIISTARIFLTAASFKAVRTMVELLDSVNEKIKLSAAKEVLDRVGIKAPETIELVSKNDSINDMTEEQLVDMVKLGMAELLPAAKRSGGDDLDDELTEVS